MIRAGTAPGASRAALVSARAPVDVAVIGGGIVGTSLAAFLAGAGLRVRLYERSEIAAGASGRNSGIVQHPFDAVLADLYHRTLGEYRDLADELSGEEPRFRLAAEPAGLLYVGRDDVLARETAERWAGAWPDTRPDVLSGSALRALEPALADDLVACRLAIGYPVAPAAATEAFARLATRRGVEIVTGADAVPELTAGTVRGVAVEGSVDAAGTVVVAAGPWAPAAIDGSRRWRPIRSVWGVVASVVLPEPPRHGLEASDIEIEPPDGAGNPGTGNFGVVPLADAREAGDGEGAADEPGEPIDDAAVDFSLAPGVGSSALGSTFLASEPDPAAWLEPLRRVGARYVPAIASARLVSHRHCARPVSLDGRPLVGRVPGASGLWIVAGHGPWGISTGPGSARLLADALLGNAASVIPDALDAARFGAPEMSAGGRPPEAMRDERGRQRHDSALKR